MAINELGLLPKHLLFLTLTASLSITGCGIGASTIKQAEPPRSAVDLPMTPPAGRHDPLVQDSVREMKSSPATPPPQTPDYQPVSDDVSPAKSRLINIQSRNSSLGDILHVIADSAGMNLIIGNGVQQERPVTISLRRVTPDEALVTLLESADYFYTIKDNVLTVEATGTKIFELGHPAMVQGYTVDVGGDILGSGASLTANTGSGGSGGSGGGGSSSNIKGTVSQTVKNDSKAFDFWDSLEKALQSMIASHESSSTGGPQLSRVENPTRSAGLITTAQGKTTIERPQDQPLARPLFEPQTQTNNAEPTQNVVVNRMTGTIMVTATRKNMAHIESYLDSLRKTLNRQVQIEARIIEVQLNDELKFGIDWSFLSSIKSFGTLAGGFGPVIGTLASAVDSAAPAFRLGYSGNSSKNPISGILTALKSQGEVKTLSNPRINVMNGQTALLTVGRNQNYVAKVTSNATTSNGSTTTTFTVDTSNVLSGIMIGLAPIINSKGEISLTVTPIISDLVKLEDKTIGSNSDNQVAISIPTVDLRELSTTIKVRDSELIVIGGLISNKRDMDDSKVPLVGDVPWFGWLFSKKDHIDKRSELVVLLQPILISND